MKDKKNAFSLINWLSSRTVFFLLILSSGIILRLYKWLGYSFWFDECEWLFIWPHNLWLTIRDTILIIKPCFFKFLVYFWVNLGQSEFILRLLPFIFGALSIIVIYRTAKLLFDQKVGLISALLLSFSPLHIYYSQEFTHYSLTLLLALLAVHYLVRAIRENETCLWIYFTLFNVLMLYTHYFAILLLITENVFFFYSRKGYEHITKKWVFSQLLILLLYLPWLIIVILQLHYFSLYQVYKASVDWMPKGSFVHIFQTLRLFNVGYNANFPVHSLATLIIFPILITGIFTNLKRHNSSIKLLTL